MSRPLRAHVLRCLRAQAMLLVPQPSSNADAIAFHPDWRPNRSSRSWPHAGGSPKGAIADAIKKDFVSFERFQSLFADAATKHFGSGWAFLVLNPATNRLEIMSPPNQDSPLLRGLPGLLCCDVWEHAYYLKYRNRRPDYLAAWWHAVAWDVVDERLREVRAGTSRT